ncbi:hypothetical protein JCM8547_001322 [Rhodosporidiobolus lusitaniae]
MSANPSLYADSFSQSRNPAQTFHSASLRLSLSRALTTDLAQYFHERALLEDSYIKALHKLSSRLHGNAKDTVFRELDSLGIDSREADKQLGGGLSGVRRTLENEVEEVAKVHETWKRKVEKEVEEPLRASLGKGEWRAWNAGEQQLGGNVKEYEGLVEKVQKAQSKSTRSGKSASSKLLTSQSHLSSLGSSLTSSLPAFLSQTQSLDLQHTAFLKEALVRCGTATSDLGRERMEAGERLLVQALGVDESAEAEEWALREGMKLSGGAAPVSSGLNGAGGADGLRRNGAMASVGEFGESESVSSGVGGGRNARERQETQSDAASTRSGSVIAPPERSRTISRPPAAAPIPVPTSVSNDDARSTSDAAPKSRLGGKLSSILGGSKSSRDRSSSIPNSAKYANFAAPPEAPPVPVPTSMGSPSLAPPAIQRQDSGDSNDLLGGSSSNFGVAPLQPTTADKRKSLMPGGSLFRRKSTMNSLDNQYQGEQQSPQEQAARFASQISEEPASSSSAGGGTGSPRVNVDAEGFSVPPEGPSSSAVPRLSILPDSSSLLSSSLSPSVVSQESESARLAALESVKNSLGAPPASSNLNRRSTARGRRSEAGGVRNTVYSGSSSLDVQKEEAPRRTASMASDDDVPLAVVQQQHRRAPPPPPSSSSSSAAAASAAAIGSSPPLPAPPAASPPITPATASSSTFVPSPSPFTPTFSPTTAEGGRTMSILSTTSSHANGAGLASGAASFVSASGSLSAGRPDPFAGETSPGLRAEVRETVNVLMKGGEVTRVMVSGEVSVSYRGGEGREERGEVRLKLTGLEGAEKAVPNSAFLTATPGGGGGDKGEYVLKTRELREQRGEGTTTTVLKYQLASTAAPAGIVPLTVKPTWRCEPGLARAIVSYSLNPDSPLLLSAGGSSSPFGDDEAGGGELEDLKIDLSLVPSSPSSIASFQSKPPTTSLTSGGKTLSFTLPSLSSASGAGEQKLLASLTTTPAEQAAQPGPVSVRWRVRGRTVGRVGVEVVEDGEEGGVREVRREVVGGKYSAA